MTRYLFVLFVFMMVVALPFPSSATVPITISIDNSQPVQGNDCVTINGTYGNLTIAAYQGNNARVGTGCIAADDDNSNDNLRFLTATITSSDTGVLHTITIRGVYNDPPVATAAAQTQIWYKVSGSGKFMRGGGAATDSSVSACGYIDPINSGNWGQITGACLSKTIGVLANFFGGTILSQLFGYQSVPQIDIPVGKRGLKAVVQFSFKNAGDSLQIDSNGILVYSSSSPGPGGVIPGVFVPHGKSNKCPPEADCLTPERKRRNP